MTLLVNVGDEFTQDTPPPLSRPSPRVIVKPLRTEVASSPEEKVTTTSKGALGGTRTSGLQVRNLSLYPLSYGRAAPCWHGRAAIVPCPPRDPR